MKPRRDACCPWTTDRVPSGVEKSEERIGPLNWADGLAEAG